MNILMLAPLQEENFRKIEEAIHNCHFTYSTSQDVTQEMIDWCDVIVGNPANHVQLCQPNIKAILLNSAGSDEYIQRGRLHSQTKLANASGTYGKAIAEHTIGMILSLNKNLKTYCHHMDQHLWKTIKSGKELYHSTVVIVGMGDLGYELAKRLKAFDCKIIGIRKTLSSLPPYFDELYTSERLDDVLSVADFVISALPQTPQTIHLFHKERFLKMKEDAVFVNVGRGSAVCHEDLKEVLKSGHLYGVALDVVEEEPLSSNDELWDFENVLITPHASGGYVWESTRQYFTNLLIRNLNHLLRHETLENEVDFQTGYRKIVEYK